MMKRGLYRKLVEWKESAQRKPLVLTGARQTGKTYLLKEIFGRECYENVVYLNLQNPLPEVLEAFEETLDPKRLLAKIELIMGMDVRPDKTLLIFDEIQEVPRALESLKYFYEEAPEYHVAVAGSLLGVFLHQGASFPVGKVDMLRLEPMNFGEFLEATGRGRIVRHLWGRPEETAFRSMLVDAFREYLFVGGMPEVVKNWAETQDVQRVEEVQSRILLSYQNDLSKHPEDSRQAVRIRQVFDSLPNQFAKNNDKFVYGVVKEGARAREYEMAIEWLMDAGLVRRVYRVERGDQLPLKAYVDKSAFKLYFLDIGLFRKLAEIPPLVVMQKDAIFDQFNGLMAEQFVLQELSDSQGVGMYYWTNEATAEVDFVTQVGEKIVPIEVKSGENVKAKSLQVYRQRYEPKLSVRFSMKDLEENDGLINIPLYESFLWGKLMNMIK